MKSDQADNNEIDQGLELEPSNDYEILRQQYEVLREKNRELLQITNRAKSAVLDQSEFLANMSHDLRTPLHAILSYSRFGIDKIDRISTEKIVKYFNNIEISGKKLQEMLNQIVDLSKLESGKMIFQMYSTNLPLILSSLLNQHQKHLDKKQIKVNTTIPKKSNPIICDQNKISQVMNALLSNAIHYSPEEEIVSIIMEESQLEQDPSQPGFKISFQDHRTEPLPQEAINDFCTYIDKKRIKTGGKIDGIRLAVAYKIVKYHNGSMKVQNLDQGGASYSVTLPFTQPENR